MKKTVFTLLIFMVCTIQALAYEYFTIYFSDGTKSEAFYATDVDSICYSKLSLDGIAFDEWQVQEIYTVDSVYRYPLAQIDSLSFKDVDVNKVAEDIARVMEKTDLILTDDNLEYSLTEIQKIEGVEDVSLGKDRLSIKIRDWGHVYYYYPPKDDSVFNSSSYESVMSRKKASSPGSQSPLRACIVNQIAMNQDNDVNYLKGISENVTSALNMVGVVPTYIPIPEPSFFSNDIFDYDIAFIMTHGFYDAETNLHWLLTGKEVLVRNKNGATYDKEKLRQIIQMSNYSPRKIELVGIDEVRDNDTIKVYYLAVSQEFISTGMKISDRQTIVFNTACESLMGAKWKIDEDNNLVNCPDYGLAKAFVKRGANCYLGFDDSNTIGARSGELFLFCLMNGQNLDGAYNILPDSYKFQDYYVYDNDNGQSMIAFQREDGINYTEEHHPTLRYWAKDASQRIIFPQTLDADISSDNSQPVTLHGSMNYIKFWEQKKEGKVAFSFARIPDPNKFGFLLADNPDMNQAEQLEAEGKYDDSSYTMNFEVSVTKDLQPNTTYYYRAYMNDGYSDCYGEIKQFTTGGEAEAYFIEYDDSIKYYYDEMYEQRRGSKVKIEKDYWLSNTLTKKVIFDSSFSNYYPTSFRFKGRVRLEEIENIQYLRTDSIRDMSGMFSECYSLKSLDLSSFNTSNVTDMEYMFYGCSSLSSLDLSSFNTSNVTNMGGMFNVCSSLTSLDLSSFNTSNVTDMHWMFRNCSSLTSLDLSSFNTSNVTDMEYMFDDCSSLSSLDLSSFNTSKVMDMESMFGNCSSLTNLDLSNFNTSNVTEMGCMFQGCDALESLDISNFVLNGIGALAHIKNIKYIKLCNAKMSGDMSRLFFEFGSLASLDLSNLDTSDVTDMHWMFRNCSSLTSLDLSSFNTSNVTDMHMMFDGCSALKSLDLSSFNTSNVTNMGVMFYACSSLTSLDLSNFNTSNVTDMASMFSRCSSLTSLDLSSFNTSNVTNMLYMFDNCSSLMSLDLSSFNTSNVTDMREMFHTCSSLTSLDLSSFNTSNVTDMHGMFASCNSLKSIYAGNWNYSEHDFGMFGGCYNLVGGMGTKLGYNLYGYNDDGKPLYYYCDDDGNAAHIDGGKDNPGLFTAK